MPGPKGPSVKAEKSVRISAKRVQTDLRKLLTSLGEGVIEAIKSQSGIVDPAGIFGAFANAAESINFEAPSVIRARHLLRGALARAITDLLNERLPFAKLDPSERVKLDHVIDLCLDNTEIELTGNFLKQPATLPMLETLGEDLERWLGNFFEVDEAHATAGRLPQYFAHALHEEWASDPNYYSHVTLALDSPFGLPAKAEAEWAAYHAKLVKEMAATVFDESFGLKDVYIKLRACYAKIHDEKGKKTTHKIVCDLHSEIMSWLKNGDDSDTLRLICGGPGSGKSSFAKMLAGDLAEQGNMRVLFFPLQHFRVSEKLTEAIIDNLVGGNHFERASLEDFKFASQNRPLLLIFDGIDELTSPGNAADQEIQSFLREVRTQLGIWNQDGRRILALVTGRTPSIQAVREVARLKPGHELEVLRYFHTDQERMKFHDPEGLLEHDQRSAWWALYRALVPNEPTEIPEKLKHDDLHELSSEPLLNYLLVRSRIHDEADGTPANRNSIYQKLFDQFEDRDRGKEGSTDRLPHHELYPRVMEVIALAAWHGGSERVATVEDAKALCNDDEKKAIESFLEKVGGPHRLVAAFYCNHAEKERFNVDAFEFSHKSFGEYLVAHRLVREIEKIHRLLVDIGTPSALKMFSDLTCFAPMTTDLLRFLRDEIALQADGAKAGEWQRSLIRLFQLNLTEGMPVLGAAVNSSRQAERLARNAEECLFAALNACSLVSGKISKIHWDNENSAGDFICRCRRQRKAEIAVDPEGSVTFTTYNMNCILLSLSLTDFSNQILVMQDLCGANMSGANLEGASLTGAKLADTILTGANLQNASLACSDLEYANLDGANLRGADLSEANLVDASIEGTILIGTKPFNLDLDMTNGEPVLDSV